MWAAGGWLQERAGLRRIRRGSGQLFRQAVQHHFIQMLLGGEGEVSEVRSEEDANVIVLQQRLTSGERLIAEATTEIRLSQ